MHLDQETKSKHSSLQSEGFGNRERQTTILQKRKRKHTYVQNIDVDVRAPEDTNPPDEKYLRTFTKKMCQLNTYKPVILPLFKKLYFAPEVDTDFNDEPADSSGNKPETGIMNTKLQEILNK